MARPKKIQGQPRALSPDLPIQQPDFRAGMYAELQKFGGQSRSRQLILSETGQELEAHETTGLDLTVSEDRSLSALQILLNQTGYQGNMQGQEVNSPDWKFKGVLPRLSFSYTEYLEAYGLERAGDQFQGKGREEAIAALKSLTKVRRVAYKRKRYAGSGQSKKDTYDVIVTNRPLILLIEGYQDLEEQEAERIIEGEDLPARVTRLVVEFSPLLVDSVDSFFLLKPPALHKEIAQLLPGRRISRSVSLFLEWLLTKNRKEVRIAKDLLAEKLRLDYLIKNRHRAKLEDQLQEAVETAKELGYLLEWREEPFGKGYVFTLNPERCKRIKTPEAGGPTDD